MSLRHRRKLRLERLEDRAVPATFTVTTTADAGAGSLRQAILDANANSGPDDIRFSIASGIQEIRPVAGLPAITDSVNLDGRTQPGYAGSPIIVLNGIGTQVDFPGLHLVDHFGSTIRGLVIQNFNRSQPVTNTSYGGIQITNGGDHVIQGNFVGTDVTGTILQTSHGTGIGVFDATNVQVGGSSAGDGNLVAVHPNNAILFCRVTNSRIQGNTIGTDRSGTIQLGDTFAGIPLSGITVGQNVSGGELGNNLIGGTAPGEANRISFVYYGVYVPVQAGNRISGNSISNVYGEAIGLDNDVYLENEDSLDVDVGGNDRQNRPVLTSARTSSSVTRITANLNTTANRQFRIEFFSNPTRDVPYTFMHGGAARTFLGAMTVQTAANGKADFVWQGPFLPAGHNVTATATDETTGDTSEVSLPERVMVQNAPVYAVGPGAGRAPLVKVFNQNGSLRFSFNAYDPNFRGGVHVARGDVNGDGVEDIITGAGFGGGPHVKVFNGINGVLIREFMAYDPAFRGGVNVAGCDVDGDGVAEILTGAGEGGGPHVKAFRVSDGAMVRTFFAYSQSDRGGIFVAAGDIDGDGIDDVVAGNGIVGPHEARFFRKGGTSPPISNYPNNIAQPGIGTTVACADVDGNGRADIITGQARNATSSVNVTTRGQPNNPPTTFLTYAPYATAFTGGVRLGAADLNGDGYADILTAPGPGGGPHVRGRNGIFDQYLLNLIAYEPNFTGGVFVG
jgi:hypothetical protein